MWMYSSMYSSMGRGRDIGRERGRDGGRDGERDGTEWWTTIFYPAGYDPAIRISESADITLNLFLKPR